MNIVKILLVIVAGLILVLFAVSGQKVETVDGVRLVHNTGPGAWGKTPPVVLEPIRSLGDVDTADENLAFYMPANLVLDAAGNMYVLDSGNHRIQKFGPDGKFLATMGRQGQGPGEFLYPSRIDIDAAGYLYVSDPHNNRVQVLTPDGKDHKTIRFLEGMAGDVFNGKSGELVMGPARFRMRFTPDEPDRKAELPKLVKVIDIEGQVLREFGDRRDFKDELLNDSVNQVVMTVDAEGRAHLVFPHQNRIDKYAADGRLLWRADRELPYTMDILDKGRIERKGGGVSIQAPRLNRCAESVAVDGRGRVWVVGLTRQLKKEEQVGLGVSMSMGTGGGRQIGYKVHGDTDLRETDVYRLEVFSADGTLLGTFPLDFFVDGVFIRGDRLFLLDRYRGVQFREFKIKG
ncbi:MAG: 6-bladed beta-propeller [Candidatus Aminicenantes bacterium]